MGGVVQSRLLREQEDSFLKVINFDPSLFVCAII